MWIIGGSNINDPIPLLLHDHIRELTFVAPPLKLMSLESVAKHFEKLAPAIQELPNQDVLRHAIEARAKQKYEIRYGVSDLGEPNKLIRFFVGILDKGIPESWKPYLGYAVTFGADFVFLQHQQVRRDAMYLASRRSQISVISGSLVFGGLLLHSYYLRRLK